MLFTHPLWREIVEFKHDPMCAKQVVNLRLLSLLKVPVPTVCITMRDLDSDSWYSVSNKEYQSIEQYCLEVYQATSKISAASPESSANIVSLMEHIRIMQKYLEVMWKYPRFRQLLPIDASVGFLKTIALVHDFSRFVYNGQLRYTDMLGELLVDHAFVNFPSEACLHSIRWLTGEKMPTRLNSFPLALKAIDTLGKAKRDPVTFFERGYEYERWLNCQIAQKRFPLSIPTTGGATRFVSSSEYMERDKFYTLKGVELIEKISKQPFVKIRDEVIASVPGITFKEYFESER